MTLFDSQTGDAFCDKLLQLLGNGPMTKDDFNRHLSLKQKNGVGKALEKLKDMNLIRKSQSKHEGAGRPANIWERVPG
jgi:predicted ArsR family transcriptional regulator